MNFVIFDMGSLTANLPSSHPARDPEFLRKSADYTPTWMLLELGKIQQSSNFRAIWTGRQANGKRPNTDLPWEAVLRLKWVPLWGGEREHR